MNKKLFVLILVIAIFLASCGGSKPSTTIDVTMTDFQFTPNAFTIPAGKEITLNVVNNGSVVHNFVIMKLGTTAGEAFGEEDEANIFWQEKDIPTGSDLSVTFTAPNDLIFARFCRGGEGRADITTRLYINLFPVYVCLILLIEGVPRSCTKFHDDEIMYDRSRVHEINCNFLSGRDGILIRRKLKIGQVHV